MERHDPDPLAEDSLFDQYLDALLTGGGETPEDFCARHASPGQALTDQLEGVYRLLQPTVPGPPADATPLVPEPDLPFERLGEYRLLRRLGEGGMGIVYLAQQEGLGRLVAVKVIRPEHAASPTAATRFEREGRLVARLRHPGVVTVHGVGEQQGVRYLVMELVPGRSLGERIAAGDVGPVTRPVRWALQLARALEYAHGQGIVHRDVKPSNVRITPDDRALLLDFGLAREVDSGSFTLTGSFAGSPCYAAPEQLEGGSVRDGRVDVYALGATLYECLTGCPPFAADSVEAVLRKVLMEEVVPPSKLGVAVPRDLETVLLTALEKDPRRRYPNARALAEDLEAVLELRPISASPPGPWRRALSWARRHKVGATAAGVALLTGVAAAILFVVQREVERGNDRDEAAELVRAARTRLQGYADRISAYDLARNDLFRLRSEQERGPHDVGRELQLRAAQQLVDEGDRDRELVPAEVAELLGQAARLNPRSPGLDEARAALYYQRWFAVRDDPDPELRSTFRRLVEETDPDGSWTAKVAGRAKLQLRSEPPGAEVFLFSYAALEAEPRVVLFPYQDGQAVPSLGGRWCLRVVEDDALLSRGELLTRVAGHPIESCVLVGADAGPLARGDRLISVDGEPVLDLWSARRRAPSARRCELQRTDGSEYVHETNGLHATLVDPAGLVRGGDVEVVAWRDGLRQKLHLEHGIEARVTASPALLGDGWRLGTTPVDAGLQEPGWYLAVFRLAGHELGRVSFHIDHACEHYSRPMELRTQLHPSGTTPPGFVHVAVGAYPWLPEGSSFWILESELTAADYLEFLNDPEVLATPQGAVLSLVPRDAGDRERGGRWPRDAQGRFHLPPDEDPDLPVMGVSWNDARAYVEWLNRQPWIAQGGWEADLPSYFEWRSAAYGGDSRDFVFGEHFSPAWTKGRFTRETPVPEPVLSFPVDESPWGAFDMAGGAAEWCADEVADTEQRLLMGGSWLRARELEFRIEETRRFLPEDVGADMGFRLVLRRSAR